MFWILLMEPEANCEKFKLGPKIFSIHFVKNISISLGRPEIVVLSDFAIRRGLTSFGYLNI